MKVLYFGKTLIFEHWQLKTLAIGIGFWGFKHIGLWGLILEWVWSWSMLSMCVWSRCQISTAKIQQHFTLFSWLKSDNASPQMRHNSQNAILTKLSTWECDNGDAPFSWWKSGRVSHLVHYSALAGFCICVYGVHWHARTVMSQSPSRR